MKQATTIPEGYVQIVRSAHVLNVPNLAHRLHGFGVDVVEVPNAPSGSNAFGQRSFFVPSWVVSVLEVGIVTHLRQERVFLALVKADDEFRNAALTIFSLAGKRAFEIFVTGTRE